MGKGFDAQLCHYWDGGLGKVQVCHAFNRVFNFGSTRPKEEVFKVVEPKRLERILLHFNNGTQGGGRGPILSGPPNIYGYGGIHGCCVLSTGYVQGAPDTCRHSGF